MSKVLLDRVSSRLETASFIAEKKRRMSLAINATANTVLVEDNLEAKIRYQIIKRWKLASAAMRLGLRLARLFKDIVKNIQELTLAPTIVDGALTHQLKTYCDLGDVQFSQKVKALLSDPPEMRSKEKIDTLERLLVFRLKSFARFTLTQRLQFCQIMQFQAYPKQTLIVKEGHISTAFYFILGGQVEVFKIKDGMKMRVNSFNVGECLKYWYVIW